MSTENQPDQHLTTTKNVRAYGGHVVGESMDRPNREFLITVSCDVVLAWVSSLRDTRAVTHRSEEV